LKGTAITTIIEKKREYGKKDQFTGRKRKKR